jgi:hypothetical protein
MRGERLAENRETVVVEVELGFPVLEVPLDPPPSCGVDK